jgi:type I restriction enzyme S subunit
MRSWKRLRLKNTINGAKNGVWGNDPDGDGDTKVIRVADFDRNTLTVSYVPTLRSIAKEELRGREINFGDLIIEKSGGGDKQPVGAVVSSCIRDPCTCSNFLAILRPRAEFHNRFLVYLHYTIYSSGKLWVAIKQTTGIQNLDLNSYLNIEVKIPSHFTQTKIANFLDRKTEELDQLIAAKKKLLALLDEKKRALIARAVTRGLNSDVPLKNSGVPWLGMIPEHWEVDRITRVFRERDERNNPNLPLLTVSIHSGVTLRELSKDKIEQRAEDFNSYKVARKNDISFNKMRMWQGAVGVVPADGLVSPDYVVAFSMPDVCIEYFGMLFKITNFSSECACRSHGIVWDRLRLYWDEFKDISIPVPPLKEQRLIVDNVTQQTSLLDGLIQKTESTISLLQERRAALISAAVTGKLDEEILNAN